ncbi:MAG: phosphoribosylformylglycinamidine synthase subunit PurQ [Rickettsiales bacterium]
MTSSAVIVFPGSNCDRDVIDVLDATMGAPTQKVWHADTALPKVDLVVLPGGFSYGDYLRCGAMAAHSPIMQEVKAHAERGGLVLGICNGFQMLTECGLLPGVLLRNTRLKFLCKPTWLRVENNRSAFTKGYQEGQVISIPVAHHDGNYFATEDQLKALEDNHQVAFRYCESDGEVTEESNPNGSAYNIAGILNAKGNVLGLMPHPERHADLLTGGDDGKPLFTALAELVGKAA